MNPDKAVVQPTHAPTQMVTPWKIDDSIKSENYVIKNQSGLSLAVCGYKEHAAFIVRCVNSHEELVKALKDCLPVLHPCGCHAVSEVLGQAKQALARAEGR